MSSAVTFAAVVLCCLTTILFNVRRSLSVNFGFRPLFLFADDVLLCFVYAVITVDTVARETLNSSAVFVTDAPANRARFAFFRSLKDHAFHRSLVITVAEQSV